MGGSEKGNFYIHTFSILCASHYMPWNLESLDSNTIFTPVTAQWCVLTISVPLGVGQAPVDNSRGSYKIKNVAQKKLVSFGTFRLIPYIQKIWILSTMNLPVQDLIRQKWFFGRCKNWRFQFQKWKVTCWLNLQFSTFCTFFNWFRKSCNQIFKIWF